jgi:hypothetical protein
MVADCLIYDGSYQGITRILSLGAKLELELPDQITHLKYVDILDVPTADLLSLLPECIEFVEKGCEQESARVLVHWFACSEDMCANQ